MARVRSLTPELPHATDVAKKNRYTWRAMKQNRLTDIENRCVVAKEDRGGSGMDWELGVSRCKLLHLEWVNNKIPLYSTGNYIQSFGIDYGGR